MERVKPKIEIERCWKHAYLCLAFTKLQWAIDFQFTIMKELTFLTFCFFGLYFQLSIYHQHEMGCKGVHSRGA